MERILKNFQIFNKVIKNEDSFKQFWQEQNYKLFTNDTASFQKVFFNLRKTLCDTYITDHVIFNKPLSSEHLNQIEEFQTLELDKEKLKNENGHLTKEEMQLKDKKVNHLTCESGTYS
jgi:uncharacterized surface protein with fasciclin (FAS1) repeats